MFSHQIRVRENEKIRKTAAAREEEEKQSADFLFGFSSGRNFKLVFGRSNEFRLSWNFVDTFGIFRAWFPPASLLFCFFYLHILRSEQMLQSKLFLLFCLYDIACFSYCFGWIVFSDLCSCLRLSCILNLIIVELGLVRNDPWFFTLDLRVFHVKIWCLVWLHFLFNWLTLNLASLGIDYLLFLIEIVV